MIIDEKKLQYTPFADTRGESGFSGRLYIGKDDHGIKYLVKSNPVDVANEYVAHNLAKLIGVPTSDAVLINDNNSVKTGIVFENDFQTVSWNDFLGTVQQKNKYEINGKLYEPPVVTEAKYPDDDPYLAEFMAYLAFRNLIILEDNVQLAFSRGHLISFDYAESFYLVERTFEGLLKGRSLSHPVGLFANHLFLKNAYKHALEFLHRPDTDFLRDAFYAPIFAFQEADFWPIFNDLDAVFPPYVSAFYGACFMFVIKEIEKLAK